MNVHGAAGIPARINRAELLLYRTLLQGILLSTFKRLTHRLLSLESATNPEGAGDE